MGFSIPYGYNKRPLRYTRLAQQEHTYWKRRVRTVHLLCEGPGSIDVDYEALSLIDSQSTLENPRLEGCS